MANIRTGTAALRASETDQVDFSVRLASIVVILVGGLLLRLILATFPGFESDLGTFQAWSRSLAADGPWNFYDSGSFVDWTPGYLYILWLFGLFDKVFTFEPNQFEFLLKMPAAAADLASVYLLYRLLDGQKMLVRLAAALIYALFPALLLVGPIWGQVDSMLAFFLLLTVFCIARGRFALAAAAYTVGFLVKPQAVAALPLFAFWILREQAILTLADLPDIGHLLQRARVFLVRLAARLGPVIFAGLGTALLIVWPFFPDNPWGIFDRLRSATEVYPYTTFLAYNLWGVLWTQSSGYPTFVSDDSTSQTWGIVLFAVSVLAIMLVFRKARGADMLTLATALSVLAFFVFITRMHERYLFPFFLPFLAAAALSGSRVLWASFVLLSLVHFFNLYYVYSLYNDNFLRFTPLFDWIGKQDTIFLLSLITVGALPALLLFSFFLSLRRPLPPGPAKV